MVTDLVLHSNWVIDFKSKRFAPSETRFLSDFSRLINHSKTFEVPTLQLAEVVVHKVPAMDASGCRLLLVVTQGYSFVYSSMQHGGGVVSVPPSPDPLTVSVLIKRNVTGHATLTA